MTKTCNKCKETKDYLEFHKLKSGKYGRSGTCANCKSEHDLKRYHKEGSTDRADRRLRIAKQKQDRWDKYMQEIGGQQCSICGFKDEYRGCFDLHHTDPKEKDMNPSQAMCGSYKSFKEEADKCILVCSNCHRKIHRRVNNGSSR